MMTRNYHEGLTLFPAMMTNPKRYRIGYNKKINLSQNRKGVIPLAKRKPMLGSLMDRKSANKLKNVTRKKRKKRKRR